MKKADLITGVVLLILAGFVVWEATNMPPSGSFGPGAGFLPLWVGIILAFLAVLLVASALLRQPTDKDKTSPFPGRKAIFPIAGVLGGLALYIILLEVLGFLVDTFLYVSFLLAAVERQGWKRTLWVAILTTCSLYVIFKILLGVTLPANSLGF
jgi:putative tricarboxylic transport membrane protein